MTATNFPEQYERITNRLLVLQQEIERRGADLIKAANSIESIRLVLLDIVRDHIPDFEEYKDLRIKLVLQAQVHTRIQAQIDNMTEERHDLIKLDKGLRIEEKRLSRVRSVISLDDYRSKKETSQRS